MTPVERARAYYRAIDGDDYELLHSVLADGFVHDRPDRTIEGRDRFVRFMREERPQTDTSHPIDAVYESEDRVAVQGTLLSADGSEITGFVDVFYEADGRVERIETYTN